MRLCELGGIFRPMCGPDFYSRDWFSKHEAEQD